MWNSLGEVLTEEFGDLPNLAQWFRIALRLVLAVVLGGVLGFEREWRGKEAGLRTHMLVALGSALFVFVPQQAGMAMADLSRVMQGLIVGIGFLGGGVILKRNNESHILGLTTAASIWLTAVVGMTVGMGRLGSAVVAVLLALLILAVLGRLETLGTRSSELSHFGAIADNPRRNIKRATKPDA